jgi:DNA-binding IscR family transcriptional regulator
LGLKECSDARPCPVHDKFIKIREDLRTMLETTTIEELASMVTSGEGILRNKKNNKKKVL